MEVRSVVRAEYCPRQRKTGDCRPKIENLRCRGGFDGNVDELLPTDSRSDDEDDGDGDPSVLFVASEGVGKG